MDELSLCGKKHKLGMFLPSGSPSPAQDGGALLEHLYLKMAIKRRLGDVTTYILKLKGSLDIFDIHSQLMQC